MSMVFQQTILINYHAIFVTFEKTLQNKEFLTLSLPDIFWHFSIYEQDKFRARLRWV